MYEHFSTQITWIKTFFKFLLPVPLLALVAMSSTTWMASTVDLPFRKLNKLRTMYLTRSKLSRPGVFLLVINLLVTILKARPHGSFWTSPIKSFQHWSRLFFMPCLRADFAFFRASRSRRSTFERVNLRRALRHFRRRTDNWSFHQYIESPVRPCPRRGIEWSHAANTFRPATRTGDPGVLVQPSSSMSLVSSRCSRSLSFLIRLVFQRDSSPCGPFLHSLGDCVPGC